VDAEGEGALADMGGRVNRVLCRDGLANRFATLLILRAEPDSGRVRFMNAGHMPPLVLSAGEVKRHPPVAPLLGVLPDARFAEQEVDLTAGDLLVAYSDGLTEAMNGVEDFFSEERLLALMPSGRTRSQGGWAPPDLRRGRVHRRVTAGLSSSCSSAVRRPPADRAGQPPARKRHRNLSAASA
jgi:hypothetical protein